MKYKPYQPHKNDVCFAFVMAAVFAMTVLADAASVFAVARGHVAVVAGTLQATDPAILVARAGVRK